MARRRTGRRDETLGQHHRERRRFEVFLGRRLLSLLIHVPPVPHLSVLLDRFLFVHFKRRRVLDVEHCGGRGYGGCWGLGLDFVGFW